MTIRTLQVIDGRITSVDGPYDADAIEVSKAVGNMLTVNDDGLFVPTSDEQFNVALDQINTKNQQQDTKIESLETSLDALAPVSSRIGEDNIITVTKTETDYELYVPNPVDSIVSAETAPSNLEHSIPLYTLSKGGAYVLCQPDNWIIIDGNYIPSYKAETLGVVE